MTRMISITAASLVVLCSVTQVVAQQSFDELPIEEIVVVALDKCGPWPIDHTFTGDCLFAVVKRQKLDTVREIRPRLMSTCLKCERAVCEPIDPEVADVAKRRRTRFICEKLFLTPRWVGDRPRKVREDDTPLYLDFSYTISREGRVRDIRIIEFEEDLFDRSELLALLAHGAERVRFEPLRIDGARYEIINVRGIYQLDADY